MEMGLMSFFLLERHLRFLKKWSFSIMTHSIVSLISIFGVLFYIFFPFEGSNCIEQGRIISHNGRNDEVEVVEKICGEFAQSDATFVNIIPVRFDHKSLMFSYLPSGEEPKINWITDDLINVEISEKLYIYQKVEKIGTINIDYIFTIN
jgi:hypothetical protein